MFTTLEKPAPTATELLYGTALPRESGFATSDDTLTKFNYNHDLREFEKLKSTSYADAPTTTATASYYTTPTPSFYTEKPTVPTGLYSTAPAAPVLDTYHVTKSVYATPTEPVAPYHTGERTIPYQTFKPKIFEYEEPEEVPTSALEEIATVDVVEAPVELEAPVFTPDVIPHFSLNSKGVIAVAAFAAITLLLMVLLVINIVAISGGSAAISQLTADNVAISSQLDTLAGQRSEAYDIGIKNAEAIKNTPGYGAAEQIQLPPIPPTPNLNVNSDYSTNIFDQVVKFLGKIFG